MKIKTNNQWRELLNWYDLTEAQQADFDYNGADEGSYFMYKGRVHALAEYVRWNVDGWHGACNDTYFSGTCIKVSNCGDAVIVGYYYS